MTETAIRANTSEAHQLYQRGVAAARGGQKRIAAVLLTRSVQLDPRNEAAWLWLSGVVDDPHQIAFCLQAVLRLNPANERAQQGMNWLEKRKLLEHAPSSPVSPQTAAMLNIPLDTLKEREERPQSQPTADGVEHREAWWIGWRHLRGDERKSRLFLPITLIVLLASILLLHSSLVQAKNENMRRIAEAQAAEVAASVPTAAVAVTPESTAQAVAILSGETATDREAAAIYYLSALGPLRQQLRDAVDTYRNASGKPGSTSVALAAAARSAHDEVANALESLKRLEPPSNLQTAHDAYIAGLEAELLAWQDMLDFYGSYKAELSNRAGLHFQEANSHFQRAKQLLDQQPQRLELLSKMSVHTPR